MGHPSHHSWAHVFTPGWNTHTKSLAPHLEEPGKFLLTIISTLIPFTSIQIFMYTS